MHDLQDKVAVVTGGASGIGRAVAERAAAKGMKVVLADVDEAHLATTADELMAQGAEVEAVVTDVSEIGSVEALRDAALSRFGAVHLVHNNAGIGMGGLMWNIPLEDWKWVIGVNLWGVIHGIRTFVPLLIEQGEGHVVNTASAAGLTSPAFMGPYNVTKHSVVTISETLQRDLHTLGSPVGVSVLCPAFVRTGLADSDSHRPEWAPAPTGDEAEFVTATIRQLIDAGIDVGGVADQVIEAIETETFYIITHPETRAGVSLRMTDIMQGRTPGPIEVA